MLDKLKELGIRDDLICEMKEYRETYPVKPEYASRIPKLEQFYYGKEVWEQERIYLQRIWQEYSQDHGGMCLFM